MHMQTGPFVAPGGGRPDPPPAHSSLLRPLPPDAPLPSLISHNMGRPRRGLPTLTRPPTVSYTGPARTAAHPPTPQQNAITSDIYQQPNRFSGSTSPWPPLFLNY